jgi:flagellar biosynthesis/type III secretory pathway M-ring protein FliF/YscJ
MKTNYIPAYVMLTAGVIDSIFALIHHMELIDFLKQLLLVLVIFLVIGNILKIILDIGMKQMADKEEDFEEDAGQDREPLENIDANETEK